MTTNQRSARGTQQKAQLKAQLKALPLAIALTSLTPFTAMHANASALMEEVVVTAQKREENVQDVPIAITAFSGDAIKEMGATNVSDLGKSTAGVEMNNNGSLQPTYNIRGIQTSDFTVGSDPAVAIYIDGVYAGRGAGAEVPFSDVERVEILKGPQGTLFGRNTTGGAIHILSKKPNLDEAEGSVTISAGNYDKRDIDFGYSTPISDTMAFRISGTVNRRDGWQDNAVGQDSGSEDNHTLRASLLWLPTDETEVIFRASYGDMNQNSGTVATTVPTVFEAGTGRAFDGDYSDIEIDGNSKEERDMFSTSVEMNMDFDEFRFTSITAFSGFNSDFYNDEDGSADDQHHFNSDNIDDQDHFSQEFRFSGETDKLKWTAGLTWNREHVDHTTVAEFNYTTLETFAIFEALSADIDTFSGIGIPGAAVGLNPNSTEQQIANAINPIRSLLTGSGLNGLAAASFTNDLYVAAGAAGAIDVPAWALNATGSLPGDPLSCAAALAAFPAGTDLATLNSAAGADGAAACGLMPQVQARFASGGLWEETVRNRGTYESTAIFGDFTYALTDTTNLTAGIRYTYDEKDFTVETGYSPNNYFYSTTAALGGQPLPLGLAFYNNGVDGQFVPSEYSDDWSALSGRIVLDHWVNDEVMVFGSVSTGFKSGGFNSLSFGPGIEPSFDQEEVINYELGLKGDFFDGKVRVNASAYFYEYTDLQELALVGSPIPSYNLRTADAEGKGVDLEVMWSVTDQLFVAANYSWLDTEYTDYQILPAAGETAADDKEGLPRADTPENKFNIMGEYTIPLDDIGELSLRADYNWTDERLSNTTNIPVDDYELFNARITLNSIDDSWAISAWAQNVTDEEINGGYGGPAKAIGSETTWLYLPRTYGVDLTYNF